MLVTGHIWVAGADRLSPVMTASCRLVGHEWARMTGAQMPMAVPDAVRRRDIIAYLGEQKNGS